MFKDLQFQGKWRSYQQAILDDLDNHIEDEKLHIVAAPGAGKTILGLEVLRRIAKPCLILTPTITIKHQWASRLKQAFLTNKKIADDMISTNILAPKTITLSTYQGLLAGLSGQVEKDVKEDLTDEEVSALEEQAEKRAQKLSRLNEEKALKLVEILKKAKIEVLCLDEAHHLRKEWWKALEYLMEHMSLKKTVALTATPPYDVDRHEWDRYEALCGPVDAEISIPELVQAGDLCPHQDLIYFAHLREEEKQALAQHEQAAKAFVDDFLKNEEFGAAVQQLSFWNNPDPFLVELFDDPEFYLALSSYLKTQKKEIAKPFLEIFQATGEELPRLTLPEIERVLNGLIFKHGEKYPELADQINSLHQKAAKANLIENKSVQIQNNASVAQTLARSLGKLDAIEEIVKREHSLLGADLRMVILADLIKHDAFETKVDALGVVPIFRHLEALHLPKASIGILTGQIILLPKNAEKPLVDLMEKANLNKSDVTFSSFKYYPDYVTVKPKEKAKSKIVDLITDLFNGGHLTIMVGTQALLGEGWDAPSINSLVLSSAVASYMLSNQMRGRAIRVDKNHPDKISHIWHLANIKVFNIVDNWKGEEGDIGGDFESLSRRFAGYEAPSLLPPYDITNGMDRCLWGTKSTKLKEKKLDELNEKALAYTREETKTAWEKGIVKESKVGIGSVKQELDTNNKVKTLPFVDAYFTMLIAYGFLAYQACKIAYDNMAPLWVYGLIIAVFIVAMLIPTWKVLRAGRPEKMLEQIGLVMLESLYEIDAINTSPKAALLKVKKIPGVHYTVSAIGLNQKDNHVFINAMKQFLDPIDNPRYLLVRQNTNVKWWQQKDYHALPEILSENKEMANIFKNNWQKHIGYCKVIYTRNVEGRVLMLKSRAKAYSSIQTTYADKVSRWSSVLDKFV
ncbi:MAG: DEAD/DEAH box helicase family protein [Alphaproteobacteria bacterium]|nr:DEAD/DEAH box helicase family protein [Alphaproteobacteria bacterium]